MKIPTITDQMLDRCLEEASSPVLVLFKGGADPDRSVLAAKNASKVAESFDDRVIFLQIDVDENPGPGDERAHGEVPLILVYRNRKMIGRLDKSFSCEEIEQLLEAVLLE